MNRRRFVLTSLAGTIAAPVAAKAQPVTSVPTVGYVDSAPPAADGTTGLSEAFEITAMYWDERSP